MARYCEICGKGNVSGHSITHSDKKIKRIWKPNLRRIKILVNGAPVRKNVCTRCIRSGKIQRAI
jgi:large subunit ribosomal protein L28